MRTTQTILSLPVAILVYFITGLICNILPYLMDLMSLINTTRGMDLGSTELLFNWIVLFLVYSIFPIFSANLIMNLMLKKEDRYLMSILPKITFATFGVLFFALVIFISITIGTATKVIIAGYMLSIISFIIVPVALEARMLEVRSG